MKKTLGDVKQMLFSEALLFEVRDETFKVSSIGLIRADVFGDIDCVKFNS